MRSDARGAAGIPGGTADRNQSGGGGSDNGYAAKVRACVRPQVIYNVPQQQGNSNPTVQYMAKLKSNGIVENVDIRRRSEEHTSELQSLMRISYAVFCQKQKIKI